MFFDDGFAEEECYASEGAVQEVGCRGSSPLEDRKTGTGTQDEQGNCLLHEETDENGTPDSLSGSMQIGSSGQYIPLDSRSVGRQHPETELENGKTEYRDGTVTVRRVLSAGFS